jgi:lysophospholipase L1-like esterase
VNFSCPAETLVSFVAGPCAWSDIGVPLHGGISYIGSAQRQAALTFLQRERDHVGAVSLMIGGNDLFGLVVACTGNFEAPVDPGPCVDANLEAFIEGQVRLHVETVRAIRRAAPRAIVLVHLEPDIITAQSSSFGVYYDASGVVEEYNASVSAAVRHAGAVAVDFNRPFTRSRASLCRYTGLCNVDPGGQPNPDGHPSDAGYAKIAELDFSALLRAVAAR